ncbi:Histidine kinase-, DNA gyrase B-, and HSP90-like ATPase [Actinobaculum suis]|uniref:GAF domain-containing protein n=1 Tax=Actinobaculum suis TaxID=1657 RepID=A0A1B9BEU0_9ACTO|nr:GAF domain-containing protein [Actinobaculum suis]MDY5153270.1 GAF domain-containing protein [Actinobaculum suis]OCA96062.1 hypothetical protein ACU20_03375 [Actinobaculum suis]OCA96182.1 hypothetical protein ACU21_02530 [Actinobaculum suis]SDE57307.1 Histidine kinase-, DNA gyrase B-, and HSP90-like ATPase [Actinobaculum suis]
MKDLAATISRALQLTARLDQTAVLQNLAEGAMDATDCQAALIVLMSSLGEPNNILLAGECRNVATELEVKRRISFFLDQLPDEGVVIANSGLEKWNDMLDLDVMPSNALAAPIRSVDRVVGYLFLLEKEGGFGPADEQNIELLVSAAAIAVENSRLYEESNSRARWIAASRAITSELLKGSDEEDALQLIAAEMRKVSQADAALIVLPSVGDVWICEIVDGAGFEDLVGLIPPQSSLTLRVAREVRGRVVSDVSNLVGIPEKLKRFGPVLYAPMAARGESKGVILLGRSAGSPEFNLADLAMAENVASQAALALELAAARHVRAQAAQLEDRSRISRDLHDFAIQQLFASGMALSAARADLACEETVPESVLGTLDRAITSIDESVGQIRQIIYSLRDPAATVPILTRLRREISSVTSQLGFDPELTVTYLGEDITASDNTAVDDVLGSDLSDDIVAVVREGISNAVRHAQADHIWVKVSIANHRVRVTVEDDGVGVRETGRRSGLSNLAARAQRHHGSFSISPREESGTTVRWTASIG